MPPTRTKPPSIRLTRDARIARGVERWFCAAARELPWRAVGTSGERDPYRSLVSEFMLQQTQVSRVVPAFDRFIARFPDVRSLARARPEQVLRHWEGLGYYRRASLLHRAAIAIVEEHAGAVPRSVQTLREIPGIGPYTAGAVASIVFGERTPIVDANVRRVLIRIEGREAPEPEALRTVWAWDRATRLVNASGDPGAFNEGLMELGAKVCLPRNPRCAECPVARQCRARALGIQNQIPAPKVKAARSPVLHQVVVIRDRAGAAGRVLVEQRPRTGLWAGLWQFPTHETSRRGLDATGLRAWAGVRKLTGVGRFGRATTHRAVEFQVWRAVGDARLAHGGRIWVTPAKLTGVAFSVPHRLIAAAVVGGTDHPGWEPLGPS